MSSAPVGPWSEDVRLESGYGYRTALGGRDAIGAWFLYKVTFDGERVAKQLTCRGHHRSPHDAVQCALMLVEELRHADAAKAIMFIEDQLGTVAS